MLNFTVGPVQSHPSVLEIGAEQVPYFRTSEFSEVMLENERLMKEFAHATPTSRAVFMTGSGTASMEAAIVNFLTEKDKVLIINGGSFGHRFVELCTVYGIAFTQIVLPTGKTLTREELYQYDNKDYTALLVNIHETSTGVLYDIDMLGEFCKKNHLFFICDAISSFLADPIHMKNHHIDVLITGSQKALACPPGISIIVMSEQAVKRLTCLNPRCYYLNLKDALKNAERGQTPFTPAVGTLLQIHRRLKDIEQTGGVDAETERIRAIAEDFRKKIANFPLQIASDAMSNAVTPLMTKSGKSAYEIFVRLKDEYNIWVCPNGGILADKIFRVGHIGNLTPADNTTLCAALEELQKRNLL